MTSKKKHWFHFVFAHSASPKGSNSRSSFGPFRVPFNCNYASLIKELEKDMMDAVKKLEFEKAALLRDQIEFIKEGGEKLRKAKAGKFRGRGKYKYGGRKKYGGGKK